MPTASSPEAFSNESVQGGLGAKQGHASAGYYAFLDGGASGGQGVLGAALALVQFRLGSRADPDDGDAAGQVGQALLQLLAVVVRGGVLNLDPQLRHAAGDVVFVAPSFHNGGFILGCQHAAGRTQLVHGNGVQNASPRRW